MEYESEMEKSHKINKNYSYIEKEKHNKKFPRSSKSTKLLKIKNSK